MLLQPHYRTPHTIIRKSTTTYTTDAPPTRHQGQGTLTPPPADPNPNPNPTLPFPQYEQE